MSGVLCWSQSGYSLPFVVEVGGEASPEWRVRLRDQDTPLGLWLRVVSPRRASEALALRALRLIAGISYLVFSLKIYEWNQSFRPLAPNKLAGVSHQAGYHVHPRGTLHFRGILLPRFT